MVDYCCRRITPATSISDSHPIIAVRSFAPIHPDCTVRQDYTCKLMKIPESSDASRLYLTSFELLRNERTFE